MKQNPGNLKSNRRFTGAGGKRQQDARFTLCNRL